MRTLCEIERDVIDGIARHREHYRKNGHDPDYDQVMHVHESGEVEVCCEPRNAGIPQDVWNGERLRLTLVYQEGAPVCECDDGKCDCHDPHDEATNSFSAHEIYEQSHRSQLEEFYEQVFEKLGSASR